MNKIKKVVIPVAGKGTRFLPITKTISKTLLPIVDTPVIQYLLEESVASGIKEALIIIGYNQNDVINYFNTESTYLQKLNKDYEEIKYIKKLKNQIRISYVFQEEAKGLGDAVKHAKAFVGQDDFALILGDDFVFSDGFKIYGIGSLCKLYEKIPSYYLGVHEVPYDKTFKYGIVDPESSLSSCFKIKNIIEKPKDNPPSNMACVGRYILKNSIFSYLEKTKIGVGGEIQLTDALALALAKETIYASEFAGTRYDVGSKIGYVEATIAVAKSRSDLKEEIEQYLKQ